MNISNLTANSIQLAAQAQAKQSSFSSQGVFFLAVVLFLLIAQLLSSDTQRKLELTINTSV